MRYVFLVIGAVWMVVGCGAEDVQEADLLSWQTQGLYPEEQNAVWVVIPDESLTRLDTSNLSTNWMNGYFALARWDQRMLLEASRSGILVRRLPRMDASRRLWVFENIGPGGWAIPEERALFRGGFSVVLALDKEEALKLFQAGARGVAVPEKPLARTHTQALPPPIPCSESESVAKAVKSMDVNSWLDWIRQISGDKEVRLGLKRTWLRTRYQKVMFGPGAGDAFTFLQRQAEQWGYAGHMELHGYRDWSGPGVNLILTVPGVVVPGEEVLFSAHYDSVSEQSDSYAPGADDNGSGTATLLEAARIFRQFRFARTVRIIFFTGEELGLLGSSAYVSDHNLQKVLGVVNLDMIGWDGDHDRCFEIHAGTRLNSQKIGDCLVSTLDRFGLNLSNDVLTQNATQASDHASFWQAGVDAIEVGENFFPPMDLSKCKGEDFNPYYHSTEDRVGVGLHSGFAFSIAQAAVGTVASMAEPVEACFAGPPSLVITKKPAGILLQWRQDPKAQSYRIYQSRGGCAGQWVKIGETRQPSFWYYDGSPARWYRVEAVAADGFCVSPPSACVSPDS